MDNKYDVIIIGAGIAGIMTTRELTKYHKKVLLIDANKDILKVPFKTLGSFIDINDFGISNEVIASEISEMTMYSKDFSHRCEGKAYTVDKLQLHKEIIEQFNKEYLDIKTETVIEDFTFDEEKNIKEVIDTEGNRYSAKIFIDTSGIKGILSREVGLQDKDLKLATGMEYEVKYRGDPHQVLFFIGESVSGGYVWLFPVKNGKAILGFCSFRPKIMNNIPEKIDKLFSHPVLSELIEKDEDSLSGGSIPMTKVKSTFVHKNLVCVGDSVSQVNPLAGEGYHFILTSAVFASKAINKALDNNDLDYLHEYESDWKKKFYKSFRISRFLRSLLMVFTKSDFFTNLGILFIKRKKDKTLERILSGEFSIRDIFLP